MPISSQEFVRMTGFWLKYIIGRFYVRVFPLKMISCDCFLVFFNWNTHLNILIKSLLKSNNDACMFLTTEKSGVSSANDFGLDARLSAKSLIQIKKNNKPRTEPWGTPVLTYTHEEFWPFSTTRNFLLFRTSLMRLKSLPVIPLCLERMLLYHTLSVASGMSRKTHLTSWFSSHCICCKWWILTG